MSGDRGVPRLVGVDAGPLRNCLAHTPAIILFPHLGNGISVGIAGRAKAVSFHDDAASHRVDLGIAASFDNFASIDVSRRTDGVSHADRHAADAAQRVGEIRIAEAAVCLSRLRETASFAIPTASAGSAASGPAARAGRGAATRAACAAVEGYYR